MAEKKRIHRKKKHDDEQLVSAKMRETQTSAPALQLQHHQTVTPHNALQLQRTIGNAAVQRMMIQRATTYPADPQETPLEISDIQAYQAFPNTKKVLYTFAEAENSAENFDCLDAILQYEKNPTPQLAKQIYNLFIGEEITVESESMNPNTGKMQKSRKKEMTAAYAVNITGRNRVSTREKINNLDKGEIPVDLFQAVKMDVITNIMDTFSRLKFTPEWKNAYGAFVKYKKPSVGTQIKGFFSSLFGGKKNK